MDKELQEALERYWKAKDRDEEVYAYHEILLFGGKDGYRLEPRFLVWMVRILRQSARYIERRWIDRCGS